jgi:hypothetical protein
MSDEHKAALAEGRREARAIKAYLAALASRRPGRPVTPESLRARLTRIVEQLGATNDPLRRVELIQQRLDTERALEEYAVVDMESLEAGFVAAAAGYSERKGISYAAWREAGVPAALLKGAGIRRAG